jgi:hypothetical protein
MRRRSWSKGRSGMLKRHLVVGRERGEGKQPKRATGQLTRRTRSIAGILAPVSGRWLVEGLEICQVVWGEDPLGLTSSLRWSKSRWAIGLDSAGEAVISNQLHRNSRIQRNVRSVLTAQQTRDD